MKRLLAILMLAFPLAASATANFAYVQSASNTGASITSLAYSSNVASGDVLFAYFSAWSTPVAPTSLADTLTDTWILMANGVPGSGITSLWVAIAKSTGANTVTATGFDGSYRGIIVAEYSSASANYALTDFTSWGYVNGSPDTITIPVTSSSTMTSNSVGLGLVSSSSYEYMAVNFVYDYSGDGHTWTATNATIRQQNEPGGSGGTSMGFGDQDALGPLTLSAPYQVTYSQSVTSSQPGTWGNIVFLTYCSGGGAAAASNSGSVY